jgi:hypothetical protein
VAGFLWGGACFGGAVRQASSPAHCSPPRPRPHSLTASPAPLCTRRHTGAARATAGRCSPPHARAGPPPTPPPPPPPPPAQRPRRPPPPPSSDARREEAPIFGAHLAAAATRRCNSSCPAASVEKVLVYPPVGGLPLWPGGVEVDAAWLTAPPPLGCWCELVVCPCGLVLRWLRSTAAGPSLAASELPALCVCWCPCGKIKCRLLCVFGYPRQLGCWCMR